MLREAEWLNLAFFSFFAVFAGLRRMDPARRLRALLLGAAGLGLTLAAIVAPDYLPAGASRILRDWLPVLLMVLAYWQAGCFFESPNRKLQAWLEESDQRWLGKWFSAGQGSGGAPKLRGWLGAYLEFAYLFCYPMVPLALAVLYAAGLRARASEFWNAVLPASYLCYAMVPFFQTLPPRVREEQRLSGATPGPEASGLRRFNLHILRRASIGANTFPSAHVAASLAAAMAVFPLLPAAGAFLLWIALSIAAGAVLRRYHYALDALLGALIAVAAFLAAAFF